MALCITFLDIEGIRMFALGNCEGSSGDIARRYMVTHGIADVHFRRIRNIVEEELIRVSQEAVVVFC